MQHRTAFLLSWVIEFVDGGGQKSYAVKYKMILAQPPHYVLDCVLIRCPQMWFCHVRPFR